MSERIIEFKAEPKTAIYITEDFKIYAIECDPKYKLKKGKFGQPVILGNMHELGIGIEYIIKATEDKNRDGFTQYKVKNIRRERPTTESSTRLFLEEVVAPTQVDTIMEHYPDIIDLVVNNKVDEIDVGKLHGIKEHRLEVIKRKIEENFVFAELIDTFQGLIDLKVLQKLYEKYPSAKKVKNSIQKNPYECLCSLSRVGFKTADSIILALDKDLKAMDNPPFEFGFDVRDSPQRLDAALTYLLRENEGNGNTKMEVNELANQLKALVSNCMHHLKGVLGNDKVYHLDKTDKSVALLSTYKSEKHIVEMLLRGLSTLRKPWEINNIEKYRKIDEGIELTDDQFIALKELCISNISILNGVSGSGKTSTTESIINMLDDNNKSYMLLAPTGRASKVLSKYTGRQASTIHRALGYQGSWEYSENQPKLMTDVVVIDEMSMVDIDVFRALLCVIDFSRTKLLMIGDSQQIPSVGKGNILHDLVQSKTIPVTSLNEVFRYGSGGILTVATDTRQGKSFIKDDSKPSIIGDDKGYVYIPCQQEDILNQAVKIYRNLLKKNKVEDILVMSAQRVGKCGSMVVNNHIQKVANPNSLKSNVNAIRLKDVSYFENDMVMQTMNNYKSFIYEEGKQSYNEQSDEVTFISNGEIGKVIKIGKFDNNQQYMVVNYDGTEILYKYGTVLEQLNLAYAITIHKAQGSGVKNVVLLLPKCHTFMLNKNLIYVGQTRAEEKVFHLGEKYVFERAIKKSANFDRRTFMQQLINNPEDLDLKIRESNSNIEVFADLKDNKTKVNKKSTSFNNNSSLEDLEKMTDTDVPARLQKAINKGIELDFDKDDLPF